VPVGLLWDDLDCNGHLNAADGIPLLASESDIEQADPECPEIGERFTIADVKRRWGDVNCDGAVTPADSIHWLYLMANFPLDPADPACPIPGTLF
jgi:hypothetical protein